MDYAAGLTARVDRGAAKRTIVRTRVFDVLMVSTRYLVCDGPSRLINVKTSNWVLKVSRVRQSMCAKGTKLRQRVVSAKHLESVWVSRISVKNEL